MVETDLRRSDLLLSLTTYDGALGCVPGRNNPAQGNDQAKRTKESEREPTHPELGIGFVGNYGQRRVVCVGLQNRNGTRLAYFSPGIVLDETVER